MSQGKTERLTVDDADADDVIDAAGADIIST